MILWLMTKKYSQVVPFKKLFYSFTGSKQPLKASLMAFALLIVASGCASKTKLRTDGKKGEEYGKFDELFEGEMQFGLQFGSLINTGDGNDSSFAVGGDVDYRPYDLFGLRVTGLYGIDSPNPAIISFTPLIHNEYSNFRPYALLGPGLGYVKDSSGDRQLRFNISAGGGADIMLTNYAGIGLLYQWNVLFQADDYHQIGARFVMAMPSW